MYRTPTRFWTPLFLVGAFAATLSLLALRDHLDTPGRLVVEPTPPPVLVVAAR
jgi:hypothetical protein